MDWYYAKDGQQVGPVTEDELRQLRENGQVSDADLAWNESLSDWMPIGSLPQFAEAAPPEQSSEPSPPASTLTPVVSAGVAASSGTTPPGQPIPTYLWQSIVCLVLCCLPAAIPAIVYSTKVDPAVARGDFAAAKQASDNARLWCWISLGVGLVANILIFGLSFLSAFAQ